MVTRTLLVACLMSAVMTPAFAADPAPFTANVTLASDYKYRGFTQTGYKPALQGGFDVVSKSGFYAGSWNSNVEQSLLNGASLEMDIYGGYKWTIGPLTMDAGLIYLFYPGSGTPTKVDEREAYLGASSGPFSVKVYYVLSDYFALQAMRKISRPGASNGSTAGSTYVDLGFSQELGDGWGVNAHVGLLNLKNGAVNGLPGDSVADYKLGLTKDLSGWGLGLSYLTTSRKDFFTTGLTSGSKGAGDGRALFSVSRTL